MTSTSTRSVAADSNVLLSAVAGRAAQRVFEKTELVVVTTEANLDEIREYIPLFARRYTLPEDLLLNTLAILPIVVCAEHQYAAGLPRARQLLADRDPDDVALAALALTRQIPVWTNDRDFTGFPTGVYTTAQLLKSLGV